MTNDDLRPAGHAGTAPALAPTDSLLAHYKRASLGRQARRAAWDLGALVRRVEHEAPELHRRLLDTVKLLQQFALQHELQPVGDRTPRSTAALSATNPTVSPGSPRQGELF